MIIVANPSHPGEVLEEVFLAPLCMSAGALARRLGVPRTRVDDYVARFREDGALTAALNWYRATKPSAMDAGWISVPTLYAWGTDDVAVGSTAAAT